MIRKRSGLDMAFTKSSISFIFHFRKSNSMSIELGFRQESDICQVEFRR